jgi:hypothetical protein
LRSPVLLCGFTGWADAAAAASGALRYLLIKREGRPVAGFDPDSIYTYTTTRPLTLRDAANNRRIEWPALDILAIEVPEAPRDLLVLVGPEPDLRWKECVRSIFDFAARHEVSTVLTFGAVHAQVHFAGPAALMGISSDARMRVIMESLGIEDTNYQGPTSFTTTLLREAVDRGIPAASLWVAAPSYLSATSNPKLSAALLGVAEELVGQELWKGELEAAGRHMERRIEEALSSRPDLVDLLKRLQGEGEDDLDDDQPELVIEDEEESEDPGELPSSEEVLRDLEEHLRRLKDQPGSDEENS